MTDPDHQAQPELETLEHGRYRVLSTPDHGMVILRTAATCDRCESCGCGEKREPIGPIPGTVLKMMQAVGAGNGGKLPGPKEMFAAMSAMRAGRRG
jgi:hypothetical protein